MADEKRKIEISIRPSEVDYKLIFSNEKLYSERMNIFLNAYLSFLVWGKYEIAEAIKEIINDIELSKEFFAKDEKEKETDLEKIIPTVEESVAKKE